MKYYIIAGEASGDLHGSNCMREILKQDPSATFGFTGGDRMSAVAGKAPDIHIRDMAFMGFVDVLKNAGAIRRNFRVAKRSIEAFDPDLLLLVDYPGFNLRMARWAHAKNFRVDFYISPTVWAWKAGRAEVIRKYVHRMMVILPFEEAFYAGRGHRVYYVGHPLIDEIRERKRSFRTREKFLSDNAFDGRPLIAVLPGSRKQEIERMLDVMMSVVQRFPLYRFVVAGSTNLPPQSYEGLQSLGVKVIYDQTYELMAYSAAGVIKSGTSTLESALLKLPQVVCYRGGALSFAIGKWLVDVKYISLVNLIMNKEVVKELIQDDFTVDNISAELQRLLSEEAYRASMISEYEKVESMLGTGASGKVAAFVVADAKGGTG
jgi:lipid-A-disaccharide synthase